ncbi:MAG TPA: hypothetical protein VLV31_11135 [Candidatus Acidoferrales bacterium]|nr:hypothetical protein [Candidatus Acidoferrales bacterium]
MLNLESTTNPETTPQTPSTGQPIIFQHREKFADGFEKKLSETVHECLKDIFGGPARDVIYTFMEQEYSVARNNLPKHLDELFTVFHQSLGAQAKAVIGRAFAKKLYAKLDFEFHPIPKFEFADYLAIIKKRIAMEGTNPP